MLKAACVKTDAWTWIQDHDKSANGRQAWLSLVQHYDGTGELNKRVERAKEEMNHLHYKDEKSYPFERYITKLKENFFILAKDPDEALLTGKQKVEKMMNGLRSTDTNIVSARTVIFHQYQDDFDGATTFLSGLIANIHSAAQLDYGNRFLGKKRYVSATDSRDLIYKANILNRLPRGKSTRTGLEIVTGETPDISEWTDFGFYDRVWVYDHKKIELDGTGRRLARWLGVAHCVGSDLCYWLLLSTGHVVARTTVQHVTREDILNPEIKAMMG
jgi:hypothetical protein